MIRIFICLTISLGCCVLSETSGFAQSGSTDNGSQFQSAEEIAALPLSAATAARRGQAMSDRIGTSKSPANTSFYRQATAESDVYPYPAAARTSNNSSPRYSAVPQLITSSSNRNTTSTVPEAPLRTAANVNTQWRPSSPSQTATTPNQNVAQATTRQIQPTTAYRQTAYQTPTLGLGTPQYQTAQYQTAQNCCQPTYNPTAGYQVPALNPSVGTGIQQVPSLQVPGQTNINPLAGTAGQPYFQPNYQYPPGTPQYGAQGANWWTPFVTGSGAYTPLIKLQNMPVGTYLGQGIIGQPTAYVDGQPVRNLLRYISP